MFGLVWFVDSDIPRFVFAFGDFVDEILFEEIVLQLPLSARVEGETVHLAFDFAVVGSVPVNS